MNHLRNKIWDEVTLQVWEQIITQYTQNDPNLFRVQFWEQNQVWHQITNQIRNHLGNQILNQTK